MGLKSQYLQRLLNVGRKGNPLDRLDALEHDQQAKIFRRLKGAEVSEAFTSLGKMVSGEFVAPSTTATSTEPTDTGFTGSFVSGDAKTFAEGDFHIGSVAAGVLQWGGNTAGKLLAGAGAWILDAAGILITGVQFIEQHTATVVSTARRMRRGFQDVSSSPAYVIEVLDDAVGTNLITTNSDFETGSLATGYSATTGWAINSSSPYAGTYAAATSNVSGFPLTTNKYATTAGLSYRFGVFQKSTTVGCPAALIEVKWYTAAPALVKTDIVTNAAPTGSYAEVSVTLVAPATSTQFEIVITPPLDDGYLVDNLTAVAVTQYAAIRLSDVGVEAIDDSNTVLLTSNAMKNLGNSGYAYLTEQATPSTPASGYLAIFPDTGSRPSAITDTALVGQIPIATKATINANATSGTGEVVLATYTIPAAVLAQAWDGLRIITKSDSTTGASNKTHRIRFGGVGGTILATATVTGAQRIRGDVILYRTGAATQEAMGTMIDSGGGITGTSASPTQTLANAIDVVLTGQTTNAAHTVKNPMLFVEFLPMVNA